MEKEIQFSVRMKRALIDKLDQTADIEHRFRNEQINKIIWDYFYKQIDKKDDHTANTSSLQ